MRTFVRSYNDGEQAETNKHPKPLKIPIAHGTAWSVVLSHLIWLHGVKSPWSQINGAQVQTFRIVRHLRCKKETMYIHGFYRNHWKWLQDSGYKILQQNNFFLKDSHCTNWVSLLIIYQLIPDIKTKHTIWLRWTKGPLRHISFWQAIIITHLLGLFSIRLRLKGSAKDSWILCKDMSKTKARRKGAVAIMHTVLYLLIHKATVIVT